MFDDESGIKPVSFVKNRTLSLGMLLQQGGEIRRPARVSDCC